jgi:hypothetical protein
MAVEGNDLEKKLDEMPSERLAALAHSEGSIGDLAARELIEREGTKVAGELITGAGFNVKARSSR